MDQVKIGKFIAEKRKAVNLTQMQLAEKLGVTDRAVSKWENGKSLPDASIMMDLCEELKITANELLCGEEIKMEDYKEKYEQNLRELARQKDEADRRLLRLETVLIITSIIMILGAALISAYIDAPDWLRLVIIIGAVLLAFIPSIYCIKIEQVAGYYECKNCGHRYVPTLKSMWMSQHMGRTRKLKCPKCGQKTWSKKVIGKGDSEE
jgi:transcriptional regulator with XRE-family HTH domain/DNA-directed RNA polymerase subunit RPC12/RpoP